MKGSLIKTIEQRTKCKNRPLNCKKFVNNAYKLPLLFSFFLHYYIFYVIILVNIAGASVCVRVNVLVLHLSARKSTPFAGRARLSLFFTALPCFDSVFDNFCFCTVGLTTNRQRHGRMHIQIKKRKDKKTWHIPTKSNKFGKW